MATNLREDWAYCAARLPGLRGTRPVAAHDMVRLRAAMLGAGWRHVSRVSFMGTEHYGHVFYPRFYTRPELKNDLSWGIDDLATCVSAARQALAQAASA